MTRPSLALLALLAASPALALAQDTPIRPTPPPPAIERTIRVTGDGRVQVRPDVAIVLAGVESTGRDLAKLAPQAQAQLKKLLAAIEKAGIPEKDVQTARHDIAVERPWVEGKQGPITGYTVSDELKVTVRDLGKLPAVLDGVVGAGANTLRGLAFEKDDPSPDRARALALAVTAARAKAEVIAKAAGVALGPVLAVNEASAGGPVVPAVRMMAMARSDGAPVSPGELEIAAQVEVVFGIR